MDRSYEHEASGRRQDIAAPEALAAMAAVTGAAMAEPGAFDGWLRATLDEVDYGIFVIASDTAVAHSNRAGAAHLSEQSPLRLCAGRLRGRRQEDDEALRSAIADAQKRGVRRLLSVGEAAERIALSVIPLGDSAHGGPFAVLVMLGKKQMCDRLSIQSYSQAHGLTVAESRVLRELSSGAHPQEAAANLGVRVSTVRTQISSIRAKTSSGTIRDLLRTLSVLPPLTRTLSGYQ
ncbi:MAG: helix-turn-helix transcriptional regulator [Pseudomonadota bacterium]|nr:helix-turn-helix transcriptional regulator [Pseudomonadota bacterium]